MPIRYLSLLMFQIVLIPFVYLNFGYTSDPDRQAGYVETHLMVHLGFGCMMSFLRKYRYGKLAINWFLAALVAQWSLLVYATLKRLKEGVLMNLTVLFEADAVCLAVLITFGALVGRGSVGQLLFIGVIEALVGSINYHYIKTSFLAADLGLSMIVHTYGAFCGFGVSLAWRDISPAVSKSTTKPPEEVTNESDALALLGSVFLFVYWPNYNATLTSFPFNRWAYERVLANTYLALSASSVTSFILSNLFSNGKLRLEHIVNCALAGGVGVGSVCDMFITPGGAIMVGIASAFISVVGFVTMKPYLAHNYRVMDTCGVLYVHGLPGVFSGILSVVFAVLAKNSDYFTGYTTLQDIFPGRKRGVTGFDQAQFQVKALVSSIVGGFFVGLITGVTTRLRIFRPVPTEDLYDDARFFEV